MLVALVLAAGCGGDGARTEGGEQPPAAGAPAPAADGLQGPADCMASWNRDASSADRARVAELGFDRGSMQVTEAHGDSEGAGPVPVVVCIATFRGSGRFLSVRTIWEEGRATWQFDGSPGSRDGEPSAPEVELRDGSFVLPA